MHFKDSSPIQHGVPECLIHETDSRLQTGGQKTPLLLGVLSVEH